MKILLTLVLFLATNAAAFDVGGSLPQGLGDGRYVQKAGDTMSGPLTLSGSSLTVTGKGSFGDILSVTGAAGNLLTVTSGNLQPVQFESTTGTNYLYMKNSGGGAYVQSTGDDLHFFTAAGANERMTIAHSGNNTIAQNLAVQGSAFSVGGSTLVVTGGKVGVGTASPATVLSVVGVNPVLTVDANETTNDRTATINLISGGGDQPATSSVVKFGAGSTSQVYAKLQIANKANTVITTFNSDGAVTIPGSAFSVGGSTLVVTGGKVGIGATPTVPLQLAATLNGNWGAIFGNDHATGYGAKVTGGGTGTKSFEVTNYAGTPWMTVLGGGNVGIANVSPAEKLHISSGTIRIDGTNSPTVGFALCLTATGSLGHCTAVTAADGSCTCVTP